MTDTGVRTNLNVHFEGTVLPQNLSVVKDFPVKPIPIHPAEPSFNAGQWYSVDFDVRRRRVRTTGATTGCGPEHSQPA